MSFFDPDTQLLQFRHVNGSQFYVPLDELDAFVQYNIRICINYGSQFGASIVLLIILLLLTRREKRGSAVFTLNALALLFNAIRLLCQVIHFTTALEKIYPFFAYDYSEVPDSAFAISILSVVFLTLLLICVMSSLVVQVQVVCATLRRRYRRPILGLSVLMATVPIGFRIGWTVINCMYIMSLGDILSTMWLESATNIVITISICYFCAVFVTKLGFAIRQRRRLGVRDFGPMKIIFVCGCQTLTIPALLSILQYMIDVPELSSNVLTLVAISLPLSSIWAGAALGEGGQRLESQPRPRRNLWQALAFGVESASRTVHSKHVATELTASTAAQTLCYSDQTTGKKSEDSDTPLGISVEHDICVNSTRRGGLAV
ncbi:hypothetical protein N7492_002533 [Penicillium capsulatum]|uniref:Mating-type alpha-pheromone receptor PreB n=1 Tax=Penicillium capsulatum TaxID=69766 RepID=A0A9W9IHS2_9EURO|nr:hypothetical protein N7492_002533 [Penicillium capsulatum]KAJ6122863.1 hypothetical protein N7512_005328 [Penicillium capsulatum]